MRRHWKRWAPREEATLRKLYGKINNSDLSSRLGRTVEAIKFRAIRLKLTYRKERKWGKKETWFALTYPYKASRLARELNRSTDSVKAKLRELRNARTTTQPPQRSAV